MTKDFTKNFINLSDRSLSPDRRAKLGFYHGEGCLHIRPLVVVSQECVLVEVVVVPHPIPQPVKLVVLVPHASGVRLEGNISNATLRLNRMEIPPIGVGFVGGDLVDAECLGSLVDQSGKLNRISRLIGRGFYAGNNMSLYTANKVRLDPSLFSAFFAVFVVKPAGVSGSGESRRINGEVSLYRSERACALLNERFEKRSNREYGDAEGQIGKLKDKPLKSVMSPPFGDMNHPTNYLGIQKRESCSEYSDNPENIGNLDDKPLKSVMSPPYEDAKGDKHHSPRADILSEEKGMFETYTERGVDNVGNKKGESYLEAMAKVYREISKVSDVLVVVVKCPTRAGKLRRLDLDSIAILQQSGWRIHCQHRALLFEELKQANLFDGTTKKVKGRLSFFERLSYVKGQPVAYWEDCIFCVRR